ncbi:MAG: primosomal protein N' [Patescibacteria group bacterium]
MNLINVVPIARNAPQKEISYFSPGPLPKGAVIFVELKKKKVPALVTLSEDIKTKKAEIKKSSFVLKKIKSAELKFFLAPELVEAAKKTAAFFAAPLGVILKSVIPAKILALKQDTEKESRLVSMSIETAKNYHQKIFFQAEKKDRVKYYKNIIREEFAKNKSVFFCVPTGLEMEKSASLLKQGVEKHTITLHSKLNKKTLIQSLNVISQKTHPVLVIASALFLCLTDSDFGTIIIERENSPHYKLKNRPFIDFRVFASLLAETLKIRLLLGDLVPRIETYWKKEQNLISAIDSSPRILTKAEDILVNMREWRGNKFRIIGDELKEMALDAQKNQEKVLLFVNRRGHSPTIICGDCGRTIICPNCSSPLVLHADKQRKMICHKCLAVLPAIESCPYCHSWKIQSFGIGIQKTAEELEKIIPGIKISRFDSDAIKTEKQAKEFAKKFISQKNGLLLATELFFGYFGEKYSFDRVAVVSVDNLLSLPDFRINEHLFYTLINLKITAEKTFLIQTRVPEAPLFEFAVKGNITGFLNKELESRKKFGYPPFTALIKITKENKNNAELQTEIMALASRLKNFSPVEFPSFIAKIKGNYRWNILLKLKPGSWPNPLLGEILTGLSPNWKVNVDPDNLL